MVRAHGPSESLGWGGRTLQKGAPASSPHTPFFARKPRPTRRSRTPERLAALSVRGNTGPGSVGENAPHSAPNTRRAPGEKLGKRPCVETRRALPYPGGFGFSPYRRSRPYMVWATRRCPRTSIAFAGSKSGVPLAGANTGWLCGALGPPGQGFYHSRVRLLVSR